MKHIDILQTIIGRLASNSFALRGWSVTLLAGLFALAAKDTNTRLAVISYLPVIAFWGLDAYYLDQERKFRALFDYVAVSEENIPLFSLDTKLIKHQRFGWLRACFSMPLFVFHGALLFAVTIVIIVLQKG